MKADSELAEQLHHSGVGVSSEEVLSDSERAWIYQWLSGLFARELSLEALVAYRSASGSALLDRLCLDRNLAPLAVKIRSIASKQENLEAAALALAGSFSRLFLGVGGRRSAPPYESAYTGKRGLLYQEATARTAVTLMELDLHVSDGFSEPPDHLAVQLELMAALARRAEEAEADRLLRAQLDFIEERLLPWIGRFRDDCIAADREGFYATAATCLVAFVSSDVESLRGVGK